MEEKYSLKVIQNGQTTLARQVRSGAGANGQALVIKAQEAASYQLVNPVTLTSPAKLQFKRKGDDLQVSLPGGDSDMPDLVIQNYFAMEGNAVKGISQSGEWMSYDTSVFIPKAVTPGDKPVKALNPGSPVAVSLAETPVALLGKFDSPLGLAAIGGGALALGTMGKGGGSGGGGSSTPTPANNTDALSVIKSYAGAIAGSVEPTSAQYTSAGVILPTVDGVTAANVLAALNRVVSGKQPADVAGKAQLQALADALKTSWAVIIAEANGSTADATQNSAPTAADYLNVGVTVGKTTKALDLMNSALGQLSSSSVNTAAGIKDLAAAADNVMKVAASISGASVSAADLEKLGLKINGANSGITSKLAADFKDNLANLKSGLGTSDALNTGEAVDTYEELQALFSLQAMRTYNDDTASTKTQPAPGVADYTNIGIKSYASLSDLTANTNSVPLDYTKFGLTSDSALAATLNSALDNQASGTALTKTVLQNMVEAYYRVLKEAGSTTSNTGTYFNDPANNPSLANYISIGITKSDANKTALADATDVGLKTLLNDAIGRLPVSAVDTASEIQALEKAAENILAIGAGTGAGTTRTGVTYTIDADWLSGFSLLGVTGVTATNLAAIKTAIDAKDGSNNGTAIDTVQELQAIVSLYRINDYALKSGSLLLPNLDDYKAVCSENSGLLTDPSSNYLSAYNDAVNVKNSNSFTGAEIKSMVESYNRILDEANGSSADSNGQVNPSKSDYLAVGVGDGSSSRDVIQSMLGNTDFAHLLTDVISVKTTSQVDTVTELNSLALVIARINELSDLSHTPGTNDRNELTKYQSIKGGMVTTDELQSIGLIVNSLTDQSVGVDVRNHRLYDVFDHIMSAVTTQELDSLSKLQAYINNTQSITN